MRPLAAIACRVYEPDNNFVLFARLAGACLRKAAGDFETARRSLGPPTYVFGSSDEATDDGMERDAAYFVRPDGHVSVRAVGAECAGPQTPSSRFGLTFGSPNPVMSAG